MKRSKLFLVFCVSLVVGAIGFSCFAWVFFALGVAKNPQPWRAATPVNEQDWANRVNELGIMLSSRRVVVDGDHLWFFDEWSGHSVLARVDLLNGTVEAVSSPADLGPHHRFLAVARGVEGQIAFLITDEDSLRQNRVLVVQPDGTVDDLGLLNGESAGLMDHLFQCHNIVGFGYLGSELNIFLRHSATHYRHMTYEPGEGWGDRFVEIPVQQAGYQTVFLLAHPIEWLNQPDGIWELLFARHPVDETGQRLDQPGEIIGFRAEIEQELVLGSCNSCSIIRSRGNLLPYVDLDELYDLQDGHLVWIEEIEGEVSSSCSYFQFDEATLSPVICSRTADQLQLVSVNVGNAQFELNDSNGLRVNNTDTAVWSDVIAHSSAPYQVRFIPTSEGYTFIDHRGRYVQVNGSFEPVDSPSLFERVDRLFGYFDSETPAYQRSSPFGLSSTGWTKPVFFLLQLFFFPIVLLVAQGINWIGRKGRRHPFSKILSWVAFFYLVLTVFTFSWFVRMVEWI